MNSKIFTIFIAFLLASCGGGSGDSSEKQPSSAASQISSSISSISSSTSSSSSSSEEAINGHVVPPEPDPVLNDSTLAGIDVNTNGVRDDVERAIAGLFEENDGHQAAMEGASILQKILIENNSNVEKLDDEFSCKAVTIDEYERAIIRQLTFNTKDREHIIENSDISKPSSIELEVNDDGLAINPCK